MLINNTIESSKRPGIPGPHRPDLKWYKDALEGKSDIGHVHKKKDITDFEHNHDGRYYRKDEHELQLLLSGNGTPNFNQGINGDYYVDELNGDLYKKSGDAWNLIIHLEGEQGAPGPQGNPGIRGPEGPTGKEGYTPVRGTDYWTPEDEEIIRQSIVSEVQLGLLNKVDKVEGKGLSTEDFTTLLKQKLEELQNYDDRNIRELLEKALYNVTIDIKTGILTFHTIDESTFTVDLPLELIVSDGYLDNNTNTIVLVLANGNTIDIPVKNLIKDLYSKAEVDKKISDLAEEIATDFEAVAEDFDKVDEELAKAQAQIDALKAENEAQQKELDVLYNDLVPGESSGEIAVVANGVTDSKVEIDVDGNTYQEVIEAVEGTTVVGTNINLKDVGTTLENPFENSILPMGNISQETVEAYQLLSIDKTNLTVVQGSAAAHIQWYDDGFISTDNEMPDAEVELIYTVPAERITPGKTYTLGIEYQYSSRASIYLRNAADDDSVKALNTNYASSIKLTNTANSNYMSISIILKVNTGVMFRLTLAEGTEQKPWQAYDPDYVMPSLNYSSSVKGVGSEEDINLLNFKDGEYTANNGSVLTVKNGVCSIAIDPSVTANFGIGATTNEPFKLLAGEKYTLVNGLNTAYPYVGLRKYKEIGTSIVTTEYNDNGLKVFTVDEDVEIGQIYLYHNYNAGNISSYPMLLKGEYTKDTLPKFTPYGYCRYNVKIENNNILPNELETQTINGITATVFEDGSINFKGTSTGNATFNIMKPRKNFLKSGVYYTLSTAEDVPENVFLRLGDASDANKYYQITGSSGAKNKHIFINSKIGENIKCIVYFGSAQIGSTFDFDIYPMLEESNDGGWWYTTHEEQNYSLDIPIGQEWYSGKPYKINGKWYRNVEWVKEYIKDYLGIGSVTDLGTHTRASIKLNNLAKGATSTSYCNYLKYLANYSHLSEHFYVEKPNSGYSYAYIFIKNDDLISIDNAGIADFIANHNDLYFLYQLETPIVEEITDTHLIEQLEALQNIKFYYEVTNISSHPLSEDITEMPLETHYNFITPIPSPNRESKVEIAESPNMFNSSYFKEETSNGVTLTQNEDGTVTLNGTSTGNTMFRILRTGQTLPGTDTEKLTIFPLEGTLSSGDLKFIAQDTNYANLRYAQIGTAKLNQKLKPNVNYNIFALTLTTGAVCKNLKLGLMIGSNIPHFIPFNHIGLLQRGKQLYDYTNPAAITSQGVTVDDDGWVTMNYDNTNGTSTVSLNYFSRRISGIKESTKYTVVIETKNVSGNANFVIASNDANVGQFYWKAFGLTQLKSNIIATTTLTAVSNLEEVADTVGLRTYMHIKAGQTANITFRLSLLRDLDVTAETFKYEPYKEKLTTIDLQGNSLAKIGEVKDLLNIGLDGSVKISDKVIKRYVFTGDENWVLSTSWVSNVTNVFYANLDINAKFEDFIDVYQKSNYFEGVSRNTAMNTDKELICYSGATKGEITAITIRANKNVASTVNDFKAWLKGKYNSGNPVYMDYQLQNPETINLPSIEPITLFEGTNVFELVTSLPTSLPTTLTAHYKVSSRKQLIENNDRITALEATVNTLLGGN